MQGVLFGPPKQIRSVTEYIEAVKDRPVEQGKILPHPRYLYRGHSDTAFGLTPSIDRNGFDVSLESRLIDMAKNRRPDEFKTENKLSLLAKMQHYGLPTRLIDFTTNPLVALYFACQNDEKDGEVLEFEEQLYRTGDGLPSYISLTFSGSWNPMDEKSERSICEDIVRRYYSREFQKEIILSLVGSVPQGGLVIEDWRGRIKEEPWFKIWNREVYGGFLDPDKHCIILAALLRCPVFVEAQETLERQRLQQGIYMLVPNEVVEEKGKHVIRSKLPQLNVKDSNVGHMVIKAEDKMGILKELDMIGINEGFLFGDSIDHVCAQIKKSVN